MSSAIHRWAALVLCCGGAAASPVFTPAVARSARFEVYSQSGTESARDVLLTFERLRVFFARQTGFPGAPGRPVRVIVFRTRDEYLPYQLRPATDAYYVSADARDSIVMTEPADGEIHVAAHEYAHFAMHANGLDLPPWLNEGLAECFAAIRVSGHDRPNGGELRAQLQLLRRHAWIPLADLVSLPADSPAREQRDRAALFYAESWALADMLMDAPAYRGHFGELMTALSSGKPTGPALAALYGRPLEQIAGDLRLWVGQRRIGLPVLPSLSAGEVDVRVSEVSPQTWQAVLARLLLSTDKLERAEGAYRDLEREAPGTAEYPAALAEIDLLKGDVRDSRQQFQRALAEGIGDAAVCYRWAVLANAAGVNTDEIRPALERAVSLQPDFDDARYLLAMLDNNAGRYDRAVENLRAMKTVAVARQYPYWSALAYALNELDRRDEALAAAAHAREYAETAEEREHVDTLAEIAQTDVAVQFMRDASGAARLVAKRIPHGTTDWNPFIEPQDRIRRVEGRLREIECGGTTRIAVVAAEGVLTLAIVDPTRVEMRNAPAEFTCGQQPMPLVTVVYAIAEDRPGIAGIVRGIEFR